jgi:hypothetical protein
MRVSVIILIKRHYREFRIQGDWLGVTAALPDKCIITRQGPMQMMIESPRGRCICCLLGIYYDDRMDKWAPTKMICVLSFAWTLEWFARRQSACVVEQNDRLYLPTVPLWGCLLSSDEIDRRSRNGDR